MDMAVTGSWRSVGVNGSGEEIKFYNYLEALRERERDRKE